MPRADLFSASWSIDLTKSEEEVQAQINAMMDEIDRMGLTPRLADEAAGD
jgi:hypothetical protein